MIMSLWANSAGPTWLDADAPLSGAAVRAAGYSTVVRYVGIGGETVPGKRLTAVELADLIAHGVTVLGAVESTRNRSNGGAAAGRADALATLADRVAAALPFLFATNDQNVPLAQAQVDYARAFRDVIGQARAGVYGYALYLRACANAGIGSVFWQCGIAPSRTGTGDIVHVWQRQGGASAVALDGPSLPTTANINGVTADVNNQLQPLPGGTKKMSVAASWDYIDQVRGRASAILPVGSNSLIVGRAWVSVESQWGAGRPIKGVRIVALGNAGLVLKDVTVDAAWNSTEPEGSIELPDGTRSVTVGWTPPTGADPEVLIPGLEAQAK
jgi:Rv2525c-like, glycoside hydrolase-like domain